MTAGAVEADRVLHDLADLWVSLGKEGESKGGVLRACAMTLVVVTESADEADLGETLAALMPHHPSRTVVVRLSGGEPEISARVFAQCWMPFGGRQQICCEQIEIRAPHQALEDVAALIVPLVAADLPVVVWAREASLLERPEFVSMARIARRVVSDSSHGGSVTSFRRLREAGHTVADLAWTRITRWRELLAQIFENPQYLAELPAVAEIEIRHSSQPIPPAARYLAAWVESCLEQVEAHPTMEFAEGGGVEGTINRLALRSPQLSVCIEKVEDGVVEVRVDGLNNRAVFQPSTEYSLLDEELSVVRRDYVFEQVLDRVCGSAAG
ncbi:MAG: glucose-6-phosphate dehydrogenase assembly protein OpcA [Bryobacteraceae bacterium]